MEHHDTGLAHDAENVSVFYVFKCNIYTLPVKTMFFFFFIVITFYIIDICWRQQIYEAR